MTLANSDAPLTAPDAPARPAAGLVRAEWRKGWPVIVASTIGFGFCLGLFMMSSGMFIAPMRAEFGWSMSQVAFAPIVTLVISVMMPLGGVAIDRFGPRRVAIFGILLFAAAYVALATLPLTLTLLYVIVGCLGILGPAGNAGPYVRIVASWFKHSTGTAFGVTMSGTSIGGMLAVPVAAMVIERYGWRMGYLANAAMLLLIVLPLALWLLRPNPEMERTAGSGPKALGGQSLGKTLVDVRFLTLMLSLGLAALPMGAYLVHLQPLLRSQGFSISVAAAYGGLFALAIGIGRVGGGMLIDRLWDYGVAASVIATAAVGCFAITALGAADPAWMMAGSVFLIGLSYGAEVDFGAYFSLKLFGLKDFSKIYGFKSLVVGGGVALGGIMSSALFDFTGNYRLLGMITGVLFLLASATMLLLSILKTPAAADAP